MSIKEIKEMKRFPRKIEEVTFEDRAKIIIKRIEGKTRTGNKKRSYKGQVEFIYSNKQTYTWQETTRRLKDIIAKSALYFESRNNQMKMREQRGQ